MQDRDRQRERERDRGREPERRDGRAGERDRHSGGKPSRVVYLSDKTRVLPGNRSPSRPASLSQGRDWRSSSADRCCPLLDLEVLSHCPTHSWCPVPLLCAVAALGGAQVEQMLMPFDKASAAVEANECALHS